MEPVVSHHTQPHSAVVGAAGALVATASVLVIVGVVPLPNFDGALEDASSTLGGWAYPAVAACSLVGESPDRTRTTRRSHATPRPARRPAEGVRAAIEASVRAGTASGAVRPDG